MANYHNISLNKVQEQKLDKLYGRDNNRFEKKMKTDEINLMIKENKEKETVNTKKISDGHHTFEMLYMQRMILFCTLCNKYKKLAWKSKKHYDEENDPMFDGDFVAGINTPKGIATYHIKLKYWDLFDIEEIERAPKYDRYSEDDVIERIMSLNENLDVSIKELIKTV